MNENKTTKNDKCDQDTTLQGKDFVNHSCHHIFLCKKKINGMKYRIHIQVR